MLNQFSKANGGSDILVNDKYYSDPNVDVKYHLLEYRIMVGYEYIDGSGNLVEVEGTDFYNRPEQGQVVASQIGSWTAQYPAINNSDFDGARDGSNTGMSISWTNSSETVVSGGTSSTATDLYYETPSLPANYDRLIVTSSYSGKQWVFRWIPGEG